MSGRGRLGGGGPDVRCLEGAREGPWRRTWLEEGYTPDQHLKKEARKVSELSWTVSPD
jgi:hypothetical protein